jgi:hypothetical protein
MEYKQSTLEELSQGYHVHTPVTLSEVPRGVKVKRDYIEGLFIREDRRVIFYILHNNNPEILDKLIRIMAVSSERNIEIEFKGRYHSNGGEFKFRGKKETLDTFAVNELDSDNVLIKQEFHR